VGFTAAFLLYLFGLIIGFGALEAENLPGIGPLMFVVTVAAGSTGLVAVLRGGERSILMVFPVLHGVSVLLFEIDDFPVPPFDQNPFAQV
jgi:hypothetical protein